MTSRAGWRSRLRDADAAAPVEITDAELRRMRQAVVAAAAASSATMWPRAFLVTATALLVVCSGLLAGLQNLTPKRAPLIVEHAAEPSPRTQLQFSTPGGTRIIWVFDSEFDLKGTTP